MKRDRDKLVSQINVAIQNVTDMNIFDETLQKAEGNNGLGKYFKSARIKQIFNQQAVIGSMSVSNLYNIAQFLNENKLMEVDLTEYFLDDEIKKAIEDVVKSEDFGDVLRFERVLANDEENEFITMVDYSTLAKMFKAGMFNYNFATQRKAKTTKIKGKNKNIDIQEADVNMKSIRAIADLVKQGKFGMNAITLNIRVDGNEKFDYNEEMMTLDIYKKIAKKDGTKEKITEIDEIDGYHRTEGIALAYEENEDIKGKITVIIKHLTVGQARAFIAQEAMGNVNNQEEMRLYNPNGNVAKLVKYVNASYGGSGMLSNRISISRNSDTYIFDSIFTKNVDKACSKILDDATDMKLREFADYICDVYNIAYEIICKKFKVKTIDELEGTIARDMMFMSGFLYPISKMYMKTGNRIDINKIREFVDKLDLKSDMEINQYTYEEADKKSFNRYVKAWETLV